MSILIFPTVNDVGSGGNGKTMTEANLSNWLSSIIPWSFVVSGLTVPGTSGTLSLAIAAGEAFISGRRVVVDSPLSVTVTANATNHIFLKLSRDASSLVTGATVVANTSGIAPVDSVKLATAVANASAITSTVDARPVGVGSGMDANTVGGKRASDISQSNIITMLTYPETSGLAVGTSDILLYATTMTWRSSFLPTGKNLYFEVEAYGSATTLTVRLCNRAGDITYGSLSIASSTVNVYSTTALTPPPDNTAISIAAKQSAGGTSGIYSARLVIR